MSSLFEAFMWSESDLNLVGAGYTAHVMTFEVGAVLEDPNWQAPVYCFSENGKENNSPILRHGVPVGSLGSLMRGITVWETM